MRKRQRKKNLMKAVRILKREMPEFIRRFRLFLFKRALMRTSFNLVKQIEAGGTIVDENGEEIEIPPELEEVARRHAEWDGKSPHPYGCDGGEGPDAGAEVRFPVGAKSIPPQSSFPRPDDSVDIQPETTDDNQTLSTVEPGDDM